jgi:hypothetical protein
MRAIYKRSSIPRGFALLIAGGKFAIVEDHAHEALQHAAYAYRDSGCNLVWSGFTIVNVCANWNGGLCQYGCGG